MDKKIDFVLNALILNKIKSYYGFETDKEFAEFLNVKPQTYNNWKSKNELNYKLLADICSEINAEWILRGDGEVQKTPKNVNGIQQNNVNGCNSNSGNVINIDDRFLKMFEESQIMLKESQRQNSDLICIMKNISTQKSNGNEQ